MGGDILAESVEQKNNYQPIPFLFPSSAAAAKAPSMGARLAPPQPRGEEKEKNWKWVMSVDNTAGHLREKMSRQRE